MGQTTISNTVSSVSNEKLEECHVEKTGKSVNDIVVDTSSEEVSATMGS